MGCLLTAVVIFVAAVLAMIFAAFSIGVIGAWFLHIPFITAWHAAWANPWKLAFLTFFILPIVRSLRD